MRWIWNDTFWRKKARFLNIFTATVYFSISVNLKIDDPLFFKFELNRTPATMPCWEVFDP
jgi:hypothetical protein